MRATLDAIKAGTYDWTRVVGLLLAVAGLVTEAAHMLDRLPPSLAPLVEAASPWAALVTLLFGGALARMGKPVVVRGES